MNRQTKIFKNVTVNKLDYKYIGNKNGDDSLIGKLKCLIEKREYYNIQQKQIIIQKEFYKYYLTLNNLISVNNLNIYDNLIKDTAEKIKN